jgi:hypothetical protein
VGELVSTCSVSCSAANRLALWRWTRALGRSAARRHAAGAPPKRRPGLLSNLVRARHGERSPIPSRQTRCGQATKPPADRGTSNPLRQRGGPLTEPFQGPARHRQRGCRARTPEAFPSGHLGGTGRVDTGRVDTGRRLDRSDGRPHGGQRTRTRPRPAWPASGHPGDRRPPAGRPNSSGSQRLGRSATQDGSAVTTPAPRP